MALSSASLFLYNFEITNDNRYLTFGNAALDMRTATIPLGFYSLSGLGQAIVRAMAAVDTANVYSFSIDRTILGGTENRFTISTSGTFLSLYFLTGNPANPASLIGFSTLDFTGATTYTGSMTCGTALIPNQLAYSYLSTKRMRKNFGAQNISASGVKETITFSLQKFWQAQFKFIPSATADNEWTPFIDWMIQQKEFEFTPQISDPNTFFSGTLESPNQGMEFELTEMLPSFPNDYQTPVMKFRQRNV